MTRSARLVAFCVGLLLPGLVAADPSTWASDIHAEAMAKVNDYRVETRSKVMAACISWPDSADGTPKIGGVAYAMTSISSDVNMSAGALRRTAQNRCLAWEAKNAVDCTCEFLDVSGKNVLQTPDY